MEKTKVRRYDDRTEGGHSSSFVIKSEGLKPPPNNGSARRTSTHRENTAAGDNRAQESRELDEEIRS